MLNICAAQTSPRRWLRSLLFATFFLAVAPGANAASGSNGICASSFDSEPEKITEQDALTLPQLRNVNRDSRPASLPSRMVELIQKSAVAQHAARGEFGVNPFLFNVYLASPGLRYHALSATHDHHFHHDEWVRRQMRESVFQMQILRALFPDSRGSFSHPHLRKMRDLPAVNPEVDFSLLAAANPAGFDLNKAELRNLFGFKPGQKVVSLSLTRYDPQGFPRQEIARFVSSVRPDVVLLSTIDENSNFSGRLAYPGFARVVRLTDWTPRMNRDSDAEGTTLILNDTHEYLANLDAAADVAVQVGALNYFRPLNTRTPIVSVLPGEPGAGYQKENAVGREFSRAVYMRYRDFARSLGGIWLTDSFIDAERHAQLFLQERAATIIQPPFTMQEDPESPLHSILEQLDTQLRPVPTWWERNIAPWLSKL